MRRNPPSAIKPQMYRHFAVATLAITALIAFFANGENHKAAAAAANAGKIAAKPIPERPKPMLVAPADDSPGSWGGDVSSAFGEPMIRLSRDAGTWMPEPLASPGASRILGPDGTTLASEDGGSAETAPAVAAPSAEQISALAAASRRRSGARGND
jgi:hypothetical protein